MTSLYKNRVQVNDLQYFLDNVSVIFLTHYARAGSLFMQSLFDQHPELIVPPFYQNVYDYSSDSESSKSFNTEQIINGYLEKNPGFFDLKDHIFGKIQNNGDRQEIEVDRNLFRENAAYLMSLLEETDRFSSRRDIFLTLGLAFYLTTQEDLHDIRSLKYYLFHLHHVHQHEEDFRKFMDDFPSAKCIAMVRDLYKSSASLLALSDDNFKTYCYRLRLQKTYICYLHEIKKRGYFVFCVDLDCLHKNMRKKLQELSNYLGITFNESLLSSTFMGFSWGGNSHSGRQYTKTKDFLEKNTYSLDTIDKLIIYKCFPGFVKSFSYPIYFSKHSLFYLLFKKMLSYKISYPHYIDYIRNQNRIYKEALQFSNVFLKKMPLSMSKKVAFCGKVFLYPFLEFLPNIIRQHVDNLKEFLLTIRFFQKKEVEI